MVFERNSNERSPFPSSVLVPCFVVEFLWNDARFSNSRRLLALLDVIEIAKGYVEVSTLGVVLCTKCLLAAVFGNLSSGEGVKVMYVEIGDRNVAVGKVYLKGGHSAGDNFVESRWANRLV